VVALVAVAFKIFSSCSALYEVRNTAPSNPDPNMPTAMINRNAPDKWPKKKKVRWDFKQIVG